MTASSGVIDFLQLANEIKTNQSLCAEIRKNPVAYLQSLGIEVQQDFHAAVEKHLQTLVKGSSSNDDPPPPPEGSFVFTTNDWGLVLVINEEGVQWLKTASVTMIGTAIGAAFAILASLSTDPIIAAIALIATAWCATQAVWIIGELVALSLMDEINHKGVYLTWSWIGLALLCYLPVPTPIV